MLQFYFTQIFLVCKWVIDLTTPIPQHCLKFGLQLFLIFAVLMFAHSRLHCARLARQSLKMSVQLGKHIIFQKLLNLMVILKSPPQRIIVLSTNQLAHHHLSTAIQISICCEFVPFVSGNDASVDSSTVSCLYWCWACILYKRRTA